MMIEKNEDDTALFSPDQSLKCTVKRGFNKDAEEICCFFIVTFRNRLIVLSAGDDRFHRFNVHDNRLLAARRPVNYPLSLKRMGPEHVEKYARQISSLLEIKNATSADENGIV
jgi:hypothetical protein